jgi:hypothetical protein
LDSSDGDGHGTATTATATATTANATTTTGGEGSTHSSAPRLRCVGICEQGLPRICEGVPDYSEYRAFLRARVVDPLTGVQAMLLRDATLWRRGVMATPCVVPQMLRALACLLGPLEAMAAALEPPAITGELRSRGNLFRHYVLALDPTRM